MDKDGARRTIQEVKGSVTRSRELRSKEAVKPVKQLFAQSGCGTDCCTSKTSLEDFGDGEVTYHNANDW